MGYGGGGKREYKNKKNKKKRRRAYMLIDLSFTLVNKEFYLILNLSKQATFQPVTIWDFELSVYLVLPETQTSRQGYRMTVSTSHRNLHVYLQSCVTDIHRRDDYRMIEFHRARRAVGTSHRAALLTTSVTHFPCQKDRARNAQSALTSWWRPWPHASHQFFHHGTSWLSLLTASISWQRLVTTDTALPVN